MGPIDPGDPRYRGHLPGHQETIADFQRDQTGIYRIFQGQKYYVPPEAFDAQGRYLGSSDAMNLGQGRSLIHNGREWDPVTGAWTNKINWGNVIGLGAGGTALGFEGAALLGAGGGPAASGTTTGVGEGGEFGAGTGFSGPAAAGGGAVPPGAAAVGSGTAPAVGRALTNAQKAEQLLAGLGGLIGGHYLGNQVGQNSVPPELSQLLQLSLDRAKQQQPLFNQINSGVSQMLPNFASAGTPTAQDFSKLLGGT